MCGCGHDHSEAIKTYLESSAVPQPKTVSTSKAVSTSNTVSHGAPVETVGDSGGSASSVGGGISGFCGGADPDPLHSGGPGDDDGVASGGESSVLCAQAEPAIQLEDGNSAPENPEDDATPRRVQPARSVRGDKFSIDEYCIPWNITRQTAMCFVDLESAWKLEMLKHQITGDYSDVCTNELAAYINQLLNSEDAVRQLEKHFGRGITTDAGTQVGNSSNAGRSCSNGVFATRIFQPGESVMYYSGVCLPVREDSDTESIPSDRKIVLDIKVTKPNGEIIEIACLLIGWENAVITENFPLAGGYIVNHCCIPNCVLKMLPLDFTMDKWKFRIMLPYVCVRRESGECIRPGEEFTCDYGEEICKLSPFYLDEHQAAITRAQKVPNPEKQNRILRDVPRNFEKGEVEDFLKGSIQLNCCCPECNLCSGNCENPIFHIPFCTSVLNLGPNDMDTTKLRNYFRIAYRPEDRMGIPSNPARHGDTSSSGLSGARLNKKGHRSPGALSSTESTGSTSSVQMARIVGDSGRSSFTGLNSGSGDSSHSKRGGDSSGAQISSKSRGRCGAVQVSDSGSLSNELRAGYTNVRRGFYDNGIYRPFALVAHSSPGRSHQENLERWRSDRCSHDREQKEITKRRGDVPETWAEAATRLLALPSVYPDPGTQAAIRANEFLHPPPPIPNKDSG